MSKGIRTSLAVLGMMAFLLGLVSGLCFLLLYVVPVRISSVFSSIVSDRFRIARIVDFSWSPDGSQIAFTRRMSYFDGVRSGIYVMDADGSNLRKLTDGESLSWSPDGGQIALSPDGSRIVFGSERSHSYYFSEDNFDYLGPEIYVMDANGRNVQRIYPLVKLERLRCPPILAENEPGTVSAVISNSGASAFPVSVEINARDLNFDPSGPRRVTIAPHERAKIAWDVTSEAEGLYIATASVASEGLRISAECPIHIGVPPILDTLGLTVKQAQRLCLLSALLGPVLFIPWLYTHRARKWALVIAAAIFLFYAIGAVGWVALVVS
jgi:hypothetical protein